MQTILTPLFLLPVLCFALSAPSRAVTLTRDGKPLAKIYTLPLDGYKPDPASHYKTESPLVSATRELQYHLQKMSGATFEVVAATDSKEVKAPAIVLGELANRMGAKPQKSTPSREGYRVVAKGELLLIGGETDEGALMGAMGVLEKLGCDWVMPGEIGEIIPEKTTIEYPNGDELSSPDFLVRSLWYRGYDAPRLPEEGARFSQWMKRNRTESFGYPAFGVGGHYWDQFIARHKNEFEKDPTMYALVRDAKGVLARRGPQLESTHPRVIELMAQDIRNAFEQNKWPHDKAAGFPIGPADGLGYSLSSESVAAGSGRIDPIVGELDRTDELVLLANRVLEKLGPEYPHVLVGFYSYSIHADYPMKYKPDPRVAVIFAPINFSRFHSVLDPNSKTQTYYRDVVQQWGKLSKVQGNPLIYRGYNWNLAENMMPYTKVRIWGEELPWYKKQGFLGLNVEATKAWSINGPGDYVYMKMAWNTGLDWKAVLHTYCAHAFGAGAPPMEHYFLRLIATQHGAGQEAGSFYAFPLIYDEAFVAAAQKDFAQAIQLAQTPNDKTRVEYFAAGIEALRLYLSFNKSANSFDFTATQAAFEAMNEHWKKTYAINTDLVANEVPYYLKRFIGDFVTNAAKYSSGDYRIVEKLPDEMPTYLDPNTIGHRLGLPDPTISDTHFVRTKTYGSTADAQGLTGIRSGAIWYRHHFRLPADVKGKPVGLFLGGFEDEARIWLNGKVVGTSGVRFGLSAVFDLTGAIKEGENVLAIQVVRNSNANEIGLGGILRPSFLFTGPRLEQVAPAPLELRRVLPGGELGEVEK